MKKMMKFFAAAFVAIVAVSCVKEMGNNGPDSDVKMVDVAFGVAMLEDDATKAHVGYNGQTPVMHWTKGDKVAVVDANTGGIYEFTLYDGEDTSEGMFTGQLPEDALNAENQQWAVVYPFSAVTSKDAYAAGDKGKMTLNAVLPVEQEAVNGGFAEGVNMLVCGTSTFEDVKMFPIGNFLKVEIEGTGITSLTVFNNDNGLNSGVLKAVIPNAAVSVSGAYLNPTSTAGFNNKVVLVPAAGETTIAPGTYYLVCRKLYAQGMTLKFTNTEGEVAFYSSYKNPEEVLGTNEDGKQIELGRNKTINLGTWDADKLKWENEDRIVIDFSSQPFTTDLPTTKNTAINGSYTLPESQKTVKIVTTAAENIAAYTESDKHGLLFDSPNDYIEFPAVAGKKLKEVQITTAFKNNLYADITDENGTVMSGASFKLYANNTYSYVLPTAEKNKKYRYVINSSTTTTNIELQKVTLIYVGEDVADIAGVTASVTKSFDGFTVTGEVLGTGLDAVTWGVEYGTSKDDFTEAATGTGTEIEHFVKAEGTYYVRVWASDDGGENKIYSETSTVTVTPFSGTITLDFSYVGAVNNISYVGTSVDGRVPETVKKENQMHNLVNECHGAYDYYTYTTPEGVWPFTMYCHGEENTKNAAYSFQITVTGGYLTGLRLGAATTDYWWISLPKVPNHRLVNVLTWSISKDARFYVCTKEESYSKNRIGYKDEDGVVDGEVAGTENSVPLYKFDLDVASASHTAEDQLWFTATSNRVFNKLILTYEKVVE